MNLTRVKQKLKFKIEIQISSDFCSSSTPSLSQLTQSHFIGVSTAASRAQSKDSVPENVTVEFKIKMALGEHELKIESVESES